VSTQNISSPSEVADGPIPILDASRYLAAPHDGAAAAALAAELKTALEDVGFYFLSGHGVPQQLVDEVFAEVTKFHALPLEEKTALRANEHNVGYMPVNGYVSRSSRVATATHPNLVEAFFVKRDLPPDHPDVLANVRYRCLNQWPSSDRLPLFRKTVVAYCDAMERLCKQMLPLYARALDLADDFFDTAFAQPQYALRMSHYPPAESGEADQYGVAPHTDSSFLTMLAQNELPGLSIRMPRGTWVDAPAITGAFLVNSGDMLRRWTNHAFLSTPHRVVNRNGHRDRYAIPFFFDATHNYPMACLPSCTGPDNPARYGPTTYSEYMQWFSRQYDHVREHDAADVADPGVPETQSTH